MAHKEAVQENTNTETISHRAAKPWYKKRLIVAPLVLIAFIAFSAIGSDSPDNNSATEDDTLSSLAAQRDGSESSNISAPEDQPGEAPVTKKSDNTPSLTVSQQNAVRSARSYISFSGFSRQGLIDQLSSEYGDKYPIEDATIAVDSLNIDYNEQAEKSAGSYLEFSGFSCQGLIDQLSSPYGDKYTLEQAQHGAKAAGVCQ